MNQWSNPSSKNLKTVFKIGAVYVFALITAVACGKFETKTAIRGTANGTATVVVDGAPGAVSDFNISIDKVETVFLGNDTEGANEWSLVVNVTHGQRKVDFDVYPITSPFFQQDQVQRTVAPMNYVLEGVCGNNLCSKFAVLLNVTDTTNGTDFQRVEYWDLMINNQAPQKRVTQTAFANVTDAYEALSFQSLQ